MALPTLIKTYSIRANTTVVAQGSVYKTKMMVYKAMVDNLILDGWTCFGSSNARVDTGGVNAGTAGLDGTNRWSTVADFAGSDGLGVPTAARFPWIVLQNSALGGGTYQILFSNNNSIQTGSMFITFSPGAGYTGGGVGTNPSATDVITAINTAAAMSGVDTTHKIHTWVSSDKEVTHVRVWRGIGVAGNNLCLSIDVQKPQDVVSGWTNPSVTDVFGNLTALATSYNILATASNRGRTSGTISIGWTGETDRTGSTFLAEEAIIGIIPNDLTNEWPFWGIGICSKTVGSKGRHGSLYDIWWKSVAIPDGATFPNDSSGRQFVACGPCILPWKSDGTQMDLV